MSVTVEELVVQERKMIDAGGDSRTWEPRRGAELNGNRRKDRAQMS